MRSTRRTGVLAIAASLALAISAVPATGIAAGILPDGGVQSVLPAVSESPLELVPAGKLVLSTGSGTGSIVREDVNALPLGAPQVLSEIGTDSCRGLGGADGPLLKFTGILNAATTTQVGFGSGSIGVKETSSETFCNQIDTTSAFTAITRKFTPETLVIALPTGDAAIVDPDFGPLKATSASLDVKLRNANSRILVTASLDGTPKAYYELRTGSFQTQTSPLVPGLPYTVTTSGAPSGTNVKWGIGDATDGVIFDSLSIRAYNGAVSLEGKSTEKTSIELGYVAKDVLSCGETLVNGTATVTYLVGATEAECQAGFSAVLSGTDEEVRFLKPLAVSPDAQFIFDVTWTRNNEGGIPTVEIPTAKIDFEFVAEGTFRDMEFCPKSVYDPETGRLVGLPSGLTETGIKDALGKDLETAPGVQFACIDQGRTVVYGKDTIEVKDTIYLIGDARMRLG